MSTTGTVSSTHPGRAEDDLATGLGAMASWYSALPRIAWRG